MQCHHNGERRNSCGSYRCRGGWTWWSSRSTRIYWNIQSDRKKEKLINWRWMDEGLWYFRRNIFNGMSTVLTIACPQLAYNAEPCQWCWLQRVISDSCLSTAAVPICLFEPSPAVERILTVYTMCVTYCSTHSPHVYHTTHQYPFLNATYLLLIFLYLNYDSLQAFHVRCSLGWDSRSSLF